MAGEFLRSHGIDIDAEMSRIQFGDENMPTSKQDNDGKTIKSFLNVSLPRTTPNTRWDVSISNSKVSNIKPHDSSVPRPSDPSHINGHSALLTPSLCHPHLHIDKAYLLSHPKYAHLQIEKGDFAEAMSLTGSAKQEFEGWDLLERGQRVIDESIAAGVTHMRAFVEVDAVVGMKCLDAGVELKRRNEARCVVQLCAFAQLPLFTTAQRDEKGEVIRRLMQEAAGRTEVAVLGSTPYVEGDRKKMERNVDWMVQLCIDSGKHLDFHLDYHLDADQEPMVWYVISCLKRLGWDVKGSRKTIVLGHCTRLAHFTSTDWKRLKEEIGDLPISFVGLPTSDLFMMRTPDRTRGTLDIPSMIKDYGLNACVSINNIGNAFTPYGSCDPVTLACNGVGIYHAGTKKDAEILFECVSTRAKVAIGLAQASETSSALGIEEGGDANLVLFGCEKEGWRTRKSVDEVVYLYDNAKGRIACLDGLRTAV